MAPGLGVVWPTKKPRDAARESTAELTRTLPRYRLENPEPRVVCTAILATLRRSVTATSVGVPEAAIVLVAAPVITKPPGRRAAEDTFVKVPL